ncbi:hypothetical protein HMN09_00136000 [Mycena chlorophos]|uniref:amidase n=1 Tax=Mycena chlorophos TaxID=658473 RepID=A0A8H6WMU2_MYCCL|nr:hypothetical protein HMN09_00136000 [Mycena chlorophos]
MPNFKALAEAKRDQRAAALDAAPPFVFSKHAKYLDASASQIVAKIGAGEWTASEVIEAYISRAAEAQKVSNCTTEILFADALKEAKALDAEFAKTGKLRGPLHGVPMSFKDQFDLTGYDTSMGYSKLLNKPATTDAEVPALLRAAGGIPILKTNIPQTLFNLECSNPVFGPTTNPYSPLYSSGGSSGGEGAVLAQDGSALGVGTDIGGSLRAPTASCGVYSLKPGLQRVSYVGVTEPNPGLEGVISVAGPLGRSIDDLDIFSRLTFGVQGNSLAVAPVPYREAKLPEKLKFGYYTDIYIKSSPATKRAVLETIDALRKQGHECVEIEIPTPETAFNAYFALCSADGYRTIFDGPGTDPIDAALEPIKNMPRLPMFIRNCIVWAANNIFGDPQLGRFLKVNGDKSVKELFEWTVKRDEYGALLYKEVWNKHNLDGIISPMLAIPHIPLGSWAGNFQLVSATSFWNVINSPVGILPVTRVDPNVDALTPEWTQPGAFPEGHFANPKTTIYRALYLGGSPLAVPQYKNVAAYDPKKSAGMPVGIQVVGKKWEEEKVIAMMRVVEGALGDPRERGFGPGSFTRAHHKED